MMKSNNQDMKANPASAGLAGLLIGAIAGATAVAISDKKTRQRLSKWSEETSRKAKATINEAVRKMNSTIDQAKKSAQEKANTSTRSLANDVPEHISGGGETLLKKANESE